MFDGILEFLLLLTYCIRLTVIHISIPLLFRTSTIVKVYVDDHQPLIVDIGGTFTDLDTQGHYYLGKNLRTF